jgi:uncharacterized membrane protein (DUF485 family)
MSFDSSELRPERQPQDPYGRPSSPAPAPHAPSWSAPELLPGPTPARSRSRRGRAGHRDLRLLRRVSRWQRRVAAFAALGYFAAFLALTVKMPSLMTRPAPGGLPTGLVLALLQLPVTWLAVLLYEATAHRYVDPLARRVRGHGRPAGADGEWRS